MYQDKSSKRMNVEGDRLSSLPDDLIHKILSFIDIKQAITTSALSSRWRYIWTSMSCLNFSNKDFHTIAKFSTLVTRVLSGRNNQIEVSSVNLTFHGKGSKVSQSYVKRILDTVLNYKSSHNVQKLNVTCSPGRRIKSLLSLFSSQSLKHLIVDGCTYEHPIMTTQLPNLTTLDLHRVTLNYDIAADKCDGLISNFVNLKNLTLKQCTITRGLSGFSICHPTLSSLTLEDGRQGGNVITPQLKNLTIKRWPGMSLISAPNLSSLDHRCYFNSWRLPADLPHLEKVHICISSKLAEDKEVAHKFVCRLQQLSSVKFLTLNLEIIKLLSSFGELVSHLPSPFVNLKSLKIYPAYVNPEEQTQPRVTMSTEVKNFFLDSSPGATITMVSHEEVRAVMNVASARNLMTKLEVLLDQWKDKAPMKRHTAILPREVEVVKHPMTQLNTKKVLHFERMARINEQFKKGYENTDRTVSILREIEGLLKKLPASDRAKLQVRFSSLCADCRG